MAIVVSMLIDTFSAFGVSRCLCNAAIHRKVPFFEFLAVSLLISTQN